MKVMRFAQLLAVALLITMHSADGYGLIWATKGIEHGAVVGKFFPGLILGTVYGACGLICDVVVYAKNVGSAPQPCPVVQPSTYTELIKVLKDISHSKTLYISGGVIVVAGIGGYYLIKRQIDKAYQRGFKDGARGRAEADAIINDVIHQGDEAAQIAADEADMIPINPRFPVPGNGTQV